jgi:hypothetical protein
MASAKHLLPMVPAGLTVLRVRPGCDKISILTAPAGAASSCPVCGRASRHVHSLRNPVIVISHSGGS